MFRGYAAGVVRESSNCVSGICLRICPEPLNFVPGICRFIRPGRQSHLVTFVRLRMSTSILVRKEVADIQKDAERRLLPLTVP